MSKERSKIIFSAFNSFLMMARRSSESPTRRTVLKKSTTAAVGGIALIGSASSSTVAQRPAPAASKTERLLEAHADDLLDTLKYRDIISSWSELPTRNKTTLGNLSSNGEGVVAVDGLGGGREIRIGTQTDTGHLTVAFDLDRGDAYAILDENGARSLIDGEGVRDLSTQSIDCGCSNVNCNGRETEYCCEDGRCVTECGC
jgi:hypothetical protein